VTRRFDAVVVGAGPAGAVAAMVLAAAGRSVALLDRERLPRYKACGGGVVEIAQAALPCRRPAASDLPLIPVRRLIVSAPGRPAIQVDRPAPVICMVMRADFDRYLAERAAEAGARLLEGTAVLDIEGGSGRLTLRTTAGPFGATAIVGADGAESRVARCLPGAAGRGAPLLGVALEGELGARPGTAWHGDRQDGAGAARFDLGAVDGGYGWVFPKAAGISAGVFTRHRICPGLRAAYRSYLERTSLGAGGAREERLTGHRIPVAPRPVRAAGGVLLAGDAAGLADPLTGEGISYAIRSGRLAAEAILAAAEDPPSAARRYEAALGAVVLPEIRAASRLAAILDAAPRLSYRCLERRGWIAEAMVDVFLGRRTYGALLAQALRRPWRLLNRSAARTPS